MKRFVGVFAAIFLLACAQGLYAQTAAGKRATARVAGTSVPRTKVSDFDPNIVYTSCDLKPGSDYRVWALPGISPMVPPQLLKKAGLNGRYDLDFVRAVAGASEADPQTEQGRALALVNYLIHQGYLQNVSSSEADWKNFQQLVRDGKYSSGSTGFNCGDVVGVMTYGGGTVDGNYSVITRSGYRMGFYPAPQAWTVVQNTTKGWQSINVIWECFNINPRPTTAPVQTVVVEEISPPPPAPPASIEVVAVASVPAFSKIWVDASGKPTKPPRKYHLKFNVIDMESGATVTSFDYEKGKVVPKTTLMPGSQLGSPYLPYRWYVVKEDPHSVPNDWHPQGPVYFSPMEHPYLSDPVEVINQREKGHGFCGPWKGVYCWAPAVFVGGLCAGGYHGFCRSQGREAVENQPTPTPNKVPVPLPPRP